MRTSLASVTLFALLAAVPPANLAQSAAPVTPTEIGADLGGCSALITVTGADSKPIFNAKVSTRIRYGFMGSKKLDLDVFTSAAGQVKIVGLPETPKKPIFFSVSKDNREQTVEFKPAEQCRASYDVHLK